MRGHSIECRINAEDPDRDFAPDRRAASTQFVPPGGPYTRVDSHCYPGWTISPFYDSLIAKLIVWAPGPRARRSTACSARWASSRSRAAA